MLPFEARRRVVFLMSYPMQLEFLNKFYLMILLLSLWLIIPNNNFSMSVRFLTDCQGDTLVCQSCFKKKNLHAYIAEKDFIGLHRMTVLILAAYETLLKKFLSNIQKN